MMNSHMSFFGQRPLALIALLAVLVSVTPIPVAHAAEAWYVAPAGSDASDCRSPAQACRTIGAAIAKSGPGDTIVLAAGSYSENLTIDRPLQLQGSGAGATIIDGGARGPVVRVIAGPTFLNDLTITNGGSDPLTGEGGGIRSSVELTLGHVVVSGNQSNEQGGGIFNAGTLSIYWGTIDNNRTPIYAGGIANTGTLYISDSSIRDNFSGRAAGGIKNDGALTIFNSTISGNTAHNDYGGGIFNNGDMMLTTVTVSGNSAGSSGAGIESFGGTAALVASTVSGNSSDGIDVRMSGQVSIRQTILAGNVTDCAGPLTSQGYNLLGMLRPFICGFSPAPGDLVGDELAPIDARLGPLADNGGSTWTHALLAGSPAIDAVPFSQCAVTNDQRGVTRIQGAGCDIGAYEVAVNLSSVLDSFTRRNGPLGRRWSGAEGLGGYQIIDRRLDVLGGGPIYWRNTIFGADQEAFVTLTQVDTAGLEQDLLLKVQGDQPDWRLGAIEVLYAARGAEPGAVRVETFRPGQPAWTRYQDIRVRLEDGDQLGAQVTSDGIVVIYRNRVPLGIIELNAADQAFFNSRGGHIGLWFIEAGDVLLSTRTEVG